MNVRVKLCGITRLEDALLGVELGVDALGFNFVEGSPRRVAPELTRAALMAASSLGLSEVARMFSSAFLENSTRVARSSRASPRTA